ncbi:tRNA wybutosine-synthesizing 1 homolog [Babesia ovis]|uniref:tRNA wybutosine-synthesizing 1 homolog n=1 Tax=Babesia ovis TaxID=5869 RepID=A0A9W5WVY1_BABOV|nr:tRNA wybutosine-synthesizing 1 homolog [Babesia ovis]
MLPSIVFAYDEDEGRIGPCYDLVESLCREFANFDVQCSSLPLSSLYRTELDKSSRQTENTSVDHDDDITCKLIQLAQCSTHRKVPCSLSTLVLIVDSKQCTESLKQFVATLQDWVTDFRISKTLLNGLHFVSVACIDYTGTTVGSGPNGEVSSILLAIDEAMKTLGANLLIKERTCFGGRDIGQIVTFTNLVQEAWDSITHIVPRSAASVNENIQTADGNQLVHNVPKKHKIGQHQSTDCSPAHSSNPNDCGCCMNTSSNPQQDAKNSPTCCETRTHNSADHKPTCLCFESSAPEDHISDSDHQSGDLNVMMCTQEDDIENIGNNNGRMVSEVQRQSLIKQGYRLIGDHSAIKLCRWTKARVRGHGGCYKHTFYGIKSNQCMEMTPSLACANKCVFCWRHHTNPVATRWKWPSDDPEFLAKESVNAHLKLIKELRGIFDTKGERLTEAMNVRHCALSLVGEPIMYPQINDLLLELHQRQISTFLVTNAQFPKEMEHLRQVTQLYLSIDAADETSLKTTDRPLFRDFWARFQRCIRLLKTRKERTVFRLTLVKHFSITDQQDEISDYARLIELGEPDFIEIKAVTFCGTVHDNAITMKNVPWHDEVILITFKYIVAQVIRYAEALVTASPFTREHYGIACEHRHSCCVLIAKKSYRVNGRWHTWIDYDKFHELAMSGREFHGIEYSIETPEWALFGSKEEGFDPVDTRVYTKGRRKLPGPPAVRPSEAPM